jgi:GntR family transcriptional regulator / MocR family aminotransferase
MALPPKYLTLILARGEGPLHRQIYDYFRTAITAGQPQAGDRLPSARTLAQQLAVARGTVDQAYAMLAGEGYVISRRPLGTIVSPGLPGVARAAAATRPRRPPAATDDLTGAPKPFQLGLPAMDAFPRKLWSRLISRHGRELSAADMGYPEHAGYWPLREAIAAYLAVARGILCDARQIVITSGYQGALDAIGRVVLRRDQKVWFEDPCYHLARAALERAAITLVPVSVDSEGLRVADGIARARDARLAVVTPSHQAPLGVALSLPRRLALLAWASEAGAYVVEDDYDGEFRYTGRPLPALKSLDRADRVLYAGSFSKVLFPGLRLGYLVLPEKLVATFTSAILSRSAGASTFEQRVVATFMREGYFARHLKRMRSLYAARRQALAEALSAVFGERVAVDLEPGGMHLVARVGSAVRDADLARKAQAAGFAIDALSSRVIRYRREGGLLLGFTNIPEVDAVTVCRRLERVIGADLA